MREPIPVGIIRWREPTDLPGANVATSLTSRKQAPQKSRHDIEFHPWANAFWVTYHPPGVGDPESWYVDAAGAVWRPEDGWKPKAPVPKKSQKAQ